MCGFASRGARWVVAIHPGTLTSPVYRTRNTKENDMTNDEKDHVALKNSERVPKPGASKAGAADPKEILSVSLRVRPRPTGTGGPNLKSYLTTTSHKKKHLTREEFSAQFGAAPADLDQVEAFAKSRGLDVVERSAGRRTIVLSGTVAKMSKAFAVTMSYYHDGKDSYRGYEGAVQLPAALSDIVETVHGLDNRPVSRPMLRGPAQGQATQALTPPQVAGLYKFPANSAAGQTIGILEFGGGFKSSDIQSYFNNTVHLPVPSVTSVSVDGATNSPGQSADTEVVLDIDVAGSVAPGAKIVVYFAPNTLQGWIDAITTAASDAVNRPSVLSISWAGGEGGWGTAIHDVSAAIQEAAAQGVTIFVSSGDGGSGNPAEVLYPASDPGVTGCGGVTIENVAGSAFEEVTWAGSGGGVSNAFPKPAWQSWVSVPPSVQPSGHVGRGVPDISGNADPASGYLLVLNGESSGPWGGTSAVAPFYAGLVAVLNASLDEPLGFVNQSLYTFAGSGVYVDVTDGSNGLYAATAGWDACTGLGSVVGTEIVTALQGVGLRDAVSVDGNGDGRLEAFVVGTDLAVWHNWQVTPGGAWSGWRSLAGVVTSDPFVAANSDRRLEVFARGTDDALWHIWQVTPGGAWSGWASLGGEITSDPCIGRNLDGRLEVFARGTDGALWHIWQMSPGGAWSGWSSLSGIITSDPVVGQNNDGRLEAFARGTDNAVWHNWQVSAGGAWSGWRSLGGVITNEPMIARNRDGRLELFARGTDNALWHIWQISPSGAWSGWSSLAGVITSDAFVTANGDGRLEAFARGTDNALWHIWQVSPGGGWSGWSSLGGVITSDAYVGQNRDGRLEAFARGTDRALWHVWQVSPGGGWSGWSSLGGVIDTDLVVQPKASVAPAPKLVDQTASV
jgi:hypothetical protein